MSAAVINTEDSRIRLSSPDVFARTREAISKVIVDEHGRMLEDRELSHVHITYVKYLDNGCVERAYSEEEASAIGIYIVDIYGKSHIIMDIAKNYECAIGLSCEEICATAICSSYGIGLQNDIKNKSVMGF